MLLGLAAPSLAGPSSCNVVVDDAGDANENPAVGGTPVDSPVPTTAAVDVLTADLASDSRTLTGVVRLSAAPQPDAQSQSGYLYEIRFTVRGHTMALFAKTTVDGQSFDASEVSGPSNLPRSADGPPVTGQLDLRGRRVLIHAPWSRLEQLAGESLKGGVASEIAVYTYKAAGSQATGSFTVVADIAEARRNYVLGSPSCQRPGRS